MWGWRDYTRHVLMRMETDEPLMEKITLRQAVDDYVAFKEATGVFSKATTEKRKYALLRFEGYCQERQLLYPDELTRKDVVRYLQDQRVIRSTKLTLIYILLSFMEYLVEESLISENVAETIDKPKIFQPNTDYLTLSQLEQLFSSQYTKRPTKMTHRNILLLSLFSDLCLRVSEVIHLKLTDVRLDDREIWVSRKRDKLNKLPLNSHMVEKFQAWYNTRARFKGNDTPWVFLSSHGKPLTPQQVHNIVSDALKRAGIFKRKRGPHLLRHSGASLKARAGENLIIIQYLLGHENLNTTRRYLHFDWQELREMVDRSPRLDGERE